MNSQCRAYLRASVLLEYFPQQPDYTVTVVLPSN